MPTGHAIEIDPSHRLAPTCLYIPAYSMRDLGGYGPTLVPGGYTGTDQAFGSGPAGPYLLAQLSNRGLLANMGAGNYPSALRFTVAGTTFVRVRSLGSLVNQPNNPQIFGPEFTGSPFNIAQIWVNASGNVAFAYNSSGAGQSAASSTAATSIGYTTITATWIVGGAVNIYLGKTNIFSGTWAGSGAPSYTASTPIMILGDNTGGSRSPNMGIEMGGIFGRALSQDEAAWLDAEPYAFLIPKTPRTHSFGASSIAPSGGSISSFFLGG